MQTGYPRAGEGLDRSRISGDRGWSACHGCRGCRAGGDRLISIISLALRLIAPTFWIRQKLLMSDSWVPATPWENSEVSLRELAVGGQWIPRVQGWPETVGSAAHSGRL